MTHQTRVKLPKILHGTRKLMEKYQTIDFTCENTGICVELYNIINARPYDIFKLFLTYEIIAYIVDQTNRYSAQTVEVNHSYKQK